MTTCKYGRFIPAIILALTLHIGVLLTRLPEKATVILPEPLSIRRIAVSLGSRSEETPPQNKISPDHTVKPPLEKDTQEIAQEEEPPPEKPIEKAPVKDVSVAQPQPTKTHPPPRVTQPKQVHNVLAPRKEKIRHPKPPSPPEIDTGEEIAPAETAARIIQKASPLYQINPPPKYPRLARRRGYEGTAILKVFVDKSGRPRKVVVFSSSGHSLLDKAALKAVRSWRFQAGSRDGIPEAMNVQVPVRFQLKDL